jgi:hypothetical protein
MKWREAIGRGLRYRIGKPQRKKTASESPGAFGRRWPESSLVVATSVMGEHHVGREAVNAPAPPLEHHHIIMKRTNLRRREQTAVSPKYAHTVKLTLVP